MTSHHSHCRGSSHESVMRRYWRPWWHSVHPAVVEHQLLNGGRMTIVAFLLVVTSCFVSIIVVRGTRIMSPEVVVVIITSPSSTSSYVIVSSSSSSSACSIVVATCVDMNDTRCVMGDSERLGKRKKNI